MGFTLSGNLKGTLREILLKEILWVLHFQGTWNGVGSVTEIGQVNSERKTSFESIHNHLNHLLKAYITASIIF